MTYQTENHKLPRVDHPAAAQAISGRTSAEPAQSAQSGAERLRTANPGSAPTDYARLAAKLSTLDRNPETLNRLGVCHLRLGNYAEAVRIYRSLVLQPGCTWEREDVPAGYRRNFATALLLAGLPAGCVSVLQTRQLADHPRTAELFAAIKRWERSLTFFQRWDWRLNGIAPKDCRIAIDFEPGEFE